MNNQLFICFAAEDRYRIVEPIVYHLENFGIALWYDRYSLLMGDNRIKKNLTEGVENSNYAVVVISNYTADSSCAMEEISIIKRKYYKGEITVFPVLYELSPNALPPQLQWIRSLIFHEADRHTGTYKIGNHIACKITMDILQNYPCRSINDILEMYNTKISIVLYQLLEDYQVIDSNNLNSRLTILYAIYVVIKSSHPLKQNHLTKMLFRIFDRMFSTTKLSLKIDYRDLWLLENSTCILVNLYLDTQNLKC